MLNVGFAKQKAKNRTIGILADDTLVNAEGELIVASDGAFGGFVNFGQEHVLQEIENGRACLSPETMKDLDEQFGSVPFSENVDPSILIEEEWRMQEALR